MAEIITERLWEEFRDKNLKTGIDPDNFKLLANTFYSGMLAMMNELLNINKDVFAQLHQEFVDFQREIGHDKDQRGNSTS